MKTVSPWNARNEGAARDRRRAAADRMLDDRRRDRQRHVQQAIEEEEAQEVVPCWNRRCRVAR
jgi:hypothetical protein